MLNLVINARDAMPDGGRLTIETKNSVFPVRLNANKNSPVGRAPSGEYAGLFFTDTGVGMSPDVIARAFDPFYTTKPLGQGTGLGLSMIFGFVQQSGGHVLLSSEEGKGTTVSIYLPRYFGLMDDVGAIDVVAKPLNVEAGATVLLVEDEFAMRATVSEMLSEFGYTVLESENAMAGLNIIGTAGRIDLLLTDVGLPGGMNGRQLADAARVLRPDLKVLFITGYAESAAVGNCRMELGMEVMTKPFTMQALTSRVESMISG
jgi:CheY-like chemotaxis protein